MKKLVLLSVAALALTGCASTATAEETPEPAPNVNAEACANFETAFGAGIRASQDDPDQWDTTRGEIDTIALTADGDVKERMLALVNDWPSTLDLFIWNDLDDANTHLSGIERACATSGQTVQLQLVTVD